MIAWQERAQSDYIRHNVKKYMFKIEPLFEIQHVGGFRYNEWAVGTPAYAHKRKAQSMT